MRDGGAGPLRVRVLTRWPWSLGYGGAEIQAQRYVQHANSAGVETKFLDVYDAAAQYDILHIVGMNSGSRVLTKWARTQGKRVVVSPIFFLPPSRVVAASLTARLPITQLGYRSLRRALDSCDVVLPNSEAERRQLATVFGLAPERGTVIYNGFDRPPPDVPRDLFARQFGIDGDYLLSVAMIERRKNTLEMLRGFLESRAEGTLVLAGDFRETRKDYAGAVRRILAEHPAKVRHIGFVKDRTLLQSAYAGARAHLLCSTLETPGISNLEAAGQGCPLVVGDCPPVREYLGDVAHYCHGREVNSIARAISNALREPPARDRIRAQVERFYWEKIGAELLSIYRGIGGRG